MPLQTQCEQGRRLRFQWVCVVGCVNRLLVAAGYVCALSVASRVRTVARRMGGCKPKQPLVFEARGVTPSSGLISGAEAFDSGVECLHAIFMPA